MASKMWSSVKGTVKKAFSKAPKNLTFAQKRMMFKQGVGSGTTASHTRKLIRKEAARRATSSRQISSARKKVGAAAAGTLALGGAAAGGTYAYRNRNETRSHRSSRSR